MKQDKQTKAIRFPFGTVSLTEVLDMVVRYLEPPVVEDPVEYRKSIEQEFNRVIVLPYLPLTNKVLILSYILFEKGYISQTNSMYRMVELEENKFWHGLLQYSNITIEEDEEHLCHRANLDILMLVFANSFYTNCGEDYRVFCSMIDNALFIESVENLTAQLSAFDNERLEEYTKQAEQLIGELSKSSNRKMVGNLATVAAFNSPQLEQILNGGAQSGNRNT